jgi:hypothetical protein
MSPLPNRPLSLGNKQVSKEQVMQTIFPIVSITAVWFVCSLVNLTWWKRNPNVIAEEFRHALIVLAPLATFFVVIGMIGSWFYTTVLRFANIQQPEF